MKINDKLTGLYEDYYLENSPLMKKRKIAAEQTATHIEALLPKKPYGTMLDIGAGEGSVIAELSKRNFAKELHAVEISKSGVEHIKNRSIPNLLTVKEFDGYKIDAGTLSIDIGTAVHVLEHVEHERAFLEEITRVCKLVYIEVPLELTVRIDRSISTSGPYGHINFYNPSTFKNLLDTSNLEVLAFQIFSNSTAYERIVSGPVVGSLKHAVRTTLLKVAPSIATFAMVYLAGAVCQRKK